MSLYTCNCKVEEIRLRKNYYGKNDEVNKRKKVHILTLRRKKRPKDWSSISSRGEVLIFSPKVSECHDGLQKKI